MMQADLGFRAARGTPSAESLMLQIPATKTTIGLNTESTYDWEGEQWAVPINFTVNQLLTVGPQIIQVGGGVRYWADSPSAGADDWGARLKLTFLFPK